MLDLYKEQQKVETRLYLMLKHLCLELDKGI